MSAPAITKSGVLAAKLPAGRKGEWWARAGGTAPGRRRLLSVWCSSTSGVRGPSGAEKGLGQGGFVVPLATQSIPCQCPCLQKGIPCQHPPGPPGH